MLMNIQTMLLPHKHVRFSSSLLAIAGYVRELLSEPHTLDEIWTILESKRSHSPIKPSFTQLILAVDLLFAIRQAQSDAEGRISIPFHEYNTLQKDPILESKDLAGKNENN